MTRFGHAPVMAAGVGARLLAFALFLPMTADWSYFAMLPSLVAMGFAFTLAYGTLAIGATDGVEEAEHGLAGGLLYTSFQIGARSASPWSPPSSWREPAARRPRSGTTSSALLVPLVAAVAAVGVSLARRRVNASTPT